MRALAVLFALVALALPSATGAGGNFTVFAAASLTEVFPRIDKTPRYSFAGSDQLALQIRQGAPADVYAAASPKYPQLLYHDGLVKKPITFATNKLIVIVPKSNPAQLHTIYDLRRPGRQGRDRRPRRSDRLVHPPTPRHARDHRRRDAQRRQPGNRRQGHRGQGRARRGRRRLRLRHGRQARRLEGDEGPDSGLGAAVDPLPARGRQLDGAPGRGACVHPQGDLEARAPAPEARGVRAAPKQQ